MEGKATQGNFKPNLDFRVFWKYIRDESSLATMSFLIVFHSAIAQWWSIRLLSRLRRDVGSRCSWDISCTYFDLFLHINIILDIHQIQFGGFNTITVLNMDLLHATGRGNYSTQKSLVPRKKR
jgi:hypothetical protein